MKKRDWLAGLGIIGACALCCALPLIGSAAIVGISSFFFDPIVIVLMAIALISIGIFIFQRRKANGTSCMKPGCACKSCATGRG
ncbi:hypothetical protein GZH47_31805 (plasmid) [Paenibacillus rhizovicinus]|uniref:Mercury resistance system transport protein MerF n=1 Tax=Paenibacillus rhizovicinus TaxID=2704463 RepID=A0A6C0PCC0_9BACL|nr:hypothetical protein [Paenibacillus rhizovicinus]QHW35483.1 hypothetical protein GZH47_31805 [Paenibacillus rhizovicinus]